MYLSGLAGRERQGRCDAVTGPTCTPWADTDNYGPMQGAHEMQMEKQTRVHFHLLFFCDHLFQRQMQTQTTQLKWTCKRKKKQMEMQTRLLFHLHFASGSPTDLLYRVVYGQGSDARI